MEDEKKGRTVDELTAEIDQLTAENERLRQQVESFRKALFGQSSEKRVLHSKDKDDPDQLSLFNEAEAEQRHEEPEKASVTVPAHKRKKKRSRAEIIGNLPVEEIVHEVEDKTCDVCGSEMKTVGREFVHDELIYEPARMYLRKHYVEVVKCVSCGKDESKDTEGSDIAKEHFRKA